MIFFLFIIMTTQLVGTEKLEVTDEEYLKVASIIAQKIACDYGEKTKKDHLKSFPDKWKKFQELVQKAKEKKIYEVDERKFPGNIYAFNGNVSLPLFVGLKFALGDTKKSLSTIANNCDFTDVFDWSRGESSFKVVKEDYRLWSKDFIIEEYSVGNEVQDSNQINANNKISAMWNYIGGLGLSAYDFEHLNEAKQRIESQENVAIEHLKFTPLLLVPGVSPITTQKTHAKLLSIAYAYLAVGCFGIDEYDKMLIDAYKKRFPEQDTINQKDIKYFDIVRYVTEVVKEKNISEANDIENEYANVDKNWESLFKGQNYFNQQKTKQKSEKKRSWWCPKIIFGGSLVVTSLLFFVYKKWFSAQQKVACKN